MLGLDKPDAVRVRIEQQRQQILSADNSVLVSSEHSSVSEDSEHRKSR